MINFKVFEERKINLNKNEEGRCSKKKTHTQKGVHRDTRLNNKTVKSHELTHFNWEGPCGPVKNQNACHLGTGIFLLFPSHQLR